MGGRKGKKPAAMTAAERAAPLPTAAFGTSTSRFDVRGVGHPKSKKPGTCISATYHPRRGQSFQQDKLGPGSHEVPIDELGDDAAARTTADPRDFWTKEPRSVLKSRIAGGNEDTWISPRFASSRDQAGTAVGAARRTLRGSWQEMAATRGPGHYGASMEEAEPPFESKRLGTSISRPGPRMKPENSNRAETPGPGTYGLGGVPNAAFDRTLDKSQPQYSSFTKQGIMDFQGRDAGIKKKATDGVAPGQYHKEAPVLKPAAGDRGPYDLMTGERFDLRTKKKADALGPGQYTLKSMAPKVPNTEHLVFAKDGPRFPKVPGDRLTNSTLAQLPRKAGPTYELRKDYDTKANTAPFGRSASRSDQRECYKSEGFAGNMFETNSHSLAPNQYAHQRDWQKGSEGGGAPGTKASGSANYNNTHKSALDSDVPRFSRLQIR